MKSLLEIRVPNDELHRRLGGGIPPGSIVLVEGDRGTGKSIFSQRLLYGFLKNGHSATYVSSQYTTPEFINQMESLGYGVVPELIKRRLLFVSLYPLLVGLSERKKFLNRFVGEPRLWKTDVIIIDSVSALLSSDIGEDEAREFSLHLKRVSALGKAIVLTVNPSDIGSDALRVFEEASTMLIRLSVKVFGGDLKNSATIVKYNNAPGIFQKIIPFRVEPRVGFIVEIAAVV
ncbi:flagellar accessory protein FlaH [Thermococcus sp. 18S1]|uniref:ATPase domain-containing protein n=1 Tax=Thermococcus sp. 18S1 TaxID=1638210 RepID=UPI00143B08F1|nr:ATPase domain-containing protein [Thermococcus sp. 18S1]NJE29458.1 flagellar accessory protein FlaH [Thermococcus sp. 18S1]